MKNGAVNDRPGLLARYERQPVLRGLIQLIPFSIGSAADSALLTQLNNYRDQKLRTFFDELGSGSIELTEEQVSSNDFLHCYFATVSAALRSRRSEKICLLARILRGQIEGEVSSTDEYEEIVGIVDELSYREVQIISILYKKERDYPDAGNENDLQRAMRIWPDFEQEVRLALGIDPELLRSMLVRIQRSGCYEEFTGSFLDYTGGMGKTTPLYLKIMNAVATIADKTA